MDGCAQGASGQVDVTVTTTGGTSNSKPFSVTPHLAALDPTSGTVGTEVTVTGTAFGSTRGSSHVDFGTTQATEYTSWSDTEVKCKVPAGVFGVEILTLTTTEGTSNSKPFSVTPHMNELDPTSGTVGTPVTVIGTAFGSTRGGSYVSFGAVKATEYTSWSDTEVKCKVPAGAAKGPDTTMPVTLVTEQGSSNTQGFTVDTYESYFAEGTTREGYNEWLCLQNPSSRAVEVHATYMLFGGSPIEKIYSVPPTSRTSVNVNNEVGPGQDVSVMLWSDGEFYAERPMYFNYKQDVGGYGWTGGHCATGAPSPRKDWYFAEGTTREGFEEWVCIQNPNDAPVEAVVDYISAGAYTQQKKYDVAAKSRISVFVNGDVGPNQDISVHVQCDDPIVAERPMYFNYGGKWTGGHVVMGTDSPKTKWYFAEGSTQEGFEEWLAFQNANNQNATVTCHFLKSDGTQVDRSYPVGANSRWTLEVSQAVGVGVDSAIVVESTLPIVAERPMYFNYGGKWTGGHDVVGASAPKTSWFFAEGCTYDWADEYICVANPGTESAHVTFTFMLESGDPVQHAIDIAPGKRETVKVADIVGRGHDVSTKITSNKPVVAERPMYFNYNGWTGGHDVVGF